MSISPCFKNQAHTSPGLFRRHFVGFSWNTQSIPAKNRLHAGEKFRAGSHTPIFKTRPNYSLQFRFFQ